MAHMRWGKSHKKKNSFQLGNISKVDSNAEKKITDHHRTVKISKSWCKTTNIIRQWMVWKSNIVDIKLLIVAVFLSVVDFYAANTQTTPEFFRWVFSPCEVIVRYSDLAIHPIINLHICYSVVHMLFFFVRSAILENEYWLVRVLSHSAQKWVTHK